MYIECVTVCVNYSDFLAHTLPHNKQHFNHMLVITIPEDKETQEICRHHNVECLTTREMTEAGEPFNKAKGINVGLEYLSKRDWVVHLDADIYLPPLTRSILEKIDLQKSNIYGIDRMMCPNFEEWSKFIVKPAPMHTGWVYIHPTAFPVGVRIGQYMGDGYQPIGFFQMWHPNISGVKLYPEDNAGADRTDVLHAKKWGRKNRAFIPEIIAIHLDSENSTVDTMGKNWKGRITQPFGYSPQTVTQKTITSNKWKHVGWVSAAATAGTVLVYILRKYFFEYMSF